MNAADGLILDLLAHSEWADAVFFRTWGAGPARESEDLRGRAAHMSDVRRAFVSMLGGGPPIPSPPGPPASFAELREQTVATHAGLRAFAAGLDADAMGQTVRIGFFPDPPCVISIREGLAQVVLHTQHHRGAE